MKQGGLILAAGRVRWKKKKGSGQNKYTLFVWGQKQVVLKSSKKCTPRALPSVLKALCLFLSDKAQVHPSLSALLDFQLFFVVF